MATICVFCSSSERIDTRYVDLAGQVGSQIAARGHVVVSGGGCVSCMGALARSARAAGGRTVGVIPRALVDLEVADNDADPLVVTNDMRERKGEMDRRSDAFLCLPGGLGTLEELLEIWVARTLSMHDKPIVILDPDGVYAPLRQLVDGLAASGFARENAVDAVAWCSDVGNALDSLERALAAPRQPGRAPVEEFLEAEL
jgi:uncharacterized protein (TIGR00730 family)